MGKLHLPSVTLTIIDGLNYPRALRALNHCLQFVEFGDYKIISYESGLTDPWVVQIPKFNDYSDFMIYDLNRYIETDHVLIAQWDGVIRDPSMWTDEYLEYDYIGAPWPDFLIYKPEHSAYNVGNGGFSLRSKRLQDFIATDPRFIRNREYAEDVDICRENRKLLESQGFKFAPSSLAWDFSFESHNSLESTFGIHGPHAMSSVMPDFFDLQLKEMKNEMV